MLDVQRRLAAQILKCGKNRVRFDSNKLDDITRAITKNDVRSLINQGTIFKKRLVGKSMYRARRRKKQKSLGRQKGHGSRKGRKSARLNPKRNWINKIRLQRSYVKSLRDKNTITTSLYHELYLKSKGGFFRSLRHLKLYIKERSLMKNER
ncbi:50S ribosomal protein L19e [Candidatus Woesearchaeota archaeon]|nr:50S ribosomal protein L19e [Candidatus Woesearchaeota archaeon]